MNLKPFNTPPILLTVTTTTNLVNPAAASGGVNAGSSAQYIIPRMLYFSNRTNAAIFVALWKGATGANASGTEYIAAGVATAGALNANTGLSIPANGVIGYPLYGRFDSTDFLVGGASASGVVMILMGEVGTSG